MFDDIIWMTLSFVIILKIIRFKSVSQKKNDNKWKKLTEDTNCDKIHIIRIQSISRRILGKLNRFILITIKKYYVSYET